jgi:hypothetical protein
MFNSYRQTESHSSNIGHIAISSDEKEQTLRLSVALADKHWSVLHSLICLTVNYANGGSDRQQLRLNEQGELSFPCLLASVSSVHARVQLISDTGIVRPLYHQIWVNEALAASLRLTIGAFLDDGYWIVFGRIISASAAISVADIPVTVTIAKENGHSAASFSGLSDNSGNYRMLFVYEEGDRYIQSCLSLNEESTVTSRMITVLAAER